MAARTKSKVTPKYKTKYRVKNWPSYEAALRKRGDVTLWFDEDAVAAWNAPPNGRPGGQRQYSDLAIACALTLRTVFHLPLRQLGATIGCFTADGAYDTRAIHEALAASGAAEPNIVIPPKRTAKIEPGAAERWCQRNGAIERIAEVGRRQWRKESGAHQQARAENGMFRTKRIIGGQASGEETRCQTREAMLAVDVLNRITKLGMPDSVAVPA